MPTAFVLINVEISQMESVLEKLKKINAVKEAYMLYGVYDLIAKVEADAMEKLKEIITWQVRRLEKVQSTQTMMVIE